MLFYEDKTFTVATGTDQYIATSATNNNMNHEQPNIPGQITQGKPIRYLSVCSGMEAASVAWHPLGWTPVGFSEIEPFPCAILKHRFPNVPNYGDLTKYAEWPLAVGDVDLICGGTPCQAFSVAGLRQGLADPRGNLALVFLGLVDRLRPKYVLWENVPGVLSSNRGEDFAAFVGALAELGYGFAWRCVDAQFFGVPQRRKRVYLLAIQGTGNWRTAAEILLEPEGLRGDFEASRKAGQEATPDAGSGVEAGGSILWNGSDQANAERVVDKAGTLNCDHGQRGGFICPIGEVSPVGTICADTHPGGYSGQDAYTGRLIPSTTIGTLCARDYKGVGNQYVQEGKCIPCPAPTPFRKSKRACSANDNETWVLADEANTLNNFDLGDTRTTHAVIEQQVYENNRRDALRIYNGTVPTLQSFMGTGGCNVPMVNHIMPGSVAPTIGASGPPYSRTGNERVEAEALAISFSPGNLVRKAGPNPSSETFPTLSKDSGDQNPHVATPMAVRRLTPNECLRLQGFPDNWSRIPWKGKPAEECPDGPQYKAAGNSMAVPVMAFIGNRIAEYEAKA